MAQNKLWSLLTLTAIVVVAQSEEETKELDLSKLREIVSGAGCGHKPADIVFLVDSSRSIWGPNFQRQLDFVSNVVDIFQIGYRQVRVGLATFSTKVHSQFRLIDYPTKRALQKAIRMVEQRHGGTNTAAAIRFMRRRMFKKRHGGRQRVPRVGIILTDGRSENTLTTLLEANLARRTGITIFAIGIGSGVYNYELNAIASEPKSDFVFQVTSFDALDSIKSLLATKTCRVSKAPVIKRTTPKRRPAPTTTVMTTPKPTTTTPRPTTTQTTTTTPQSTTTLAHRWKYVYPDNHHDLWTARLRRACGDRPSDVAVILDASSSIPKEDFWKQLRFIQEIVHVFTVAPDRARFSVLTFADDVREEFVLGKHTNVKGVSRAVARIEQMGGSTNTAKAIKFLRENTFLPKYARHNAARVGIILTDGQSDDPQETNRQAFLAHQEGIFLFVLGIGPNVDEEELNIIASDPNEKFVLQVKTYDSLRSVIDIVALAACRLKPPKPRPLPSDEACGSRGPTDLMFVVDSPNAGVRNTKKAMKFLETIVEKMAVSEEKVQIGTISDPCQEPTGIPLGRHKDKTSLKGHLEMTEFSDVSSLMKEMRLRGFNNGHGARSNSSKVAIIIIDGDLMHPLRALTEAQRARFHGIEVYIVSVGPVIDPSEAALMCSYPSYEHLFKVPTYDDLEGISKDLLDKMCGDTL